MLALSLSLSLSAAIQTAIRLQTESKTSLHKDLKLKRREQREQKEQQRKAKDQELQRLQALQEEKQRKLAELELLKEAQRQAQALMEQDEVRRRQQYEQLQQGLEVQLFPLQTGAKDRGFCQTRPELCMPLSSVKVLDCAVLEYATVWPCPTRLLSGKD